MTFFFSSKVNTTASDSQIDAASKSDVFERIKVLKSNFFHFKQQLFLENVWC